ncbi:MAG: DUF4124 domain-containing protein [Rhodanobacteraceae bacterium]|nr:MAG: DUF4124 domain-containing protein [Rhodanobacteraceae bacterium]
MRHRSPPQQSSPSTPRRPSPRTRLFCAGWLLLIVAGAHAATVYRCADKTGHVAYQDNPCGELTQQRAIDLSPQPWIGGAGAIAPTATPHEHQRAVFRRRPRRERIRHVKPANAWACHAADGEVFYRFARCPGSVPGDGVVRNDYTQSRLNLRRRGRHDAWSRVRVHGVRVTRAEACQRIHSVTASSRDGYLRDADVSTYDHLMGRDPCTGN